MGECFCPDAVDELLISTANRSDPDLEKEAQTAAISDVQDTKLTSKSRDCKGGGFWEALR